MESVKRKLIAAYLFLLLCHASHIFEEVWGKLFWVRYLGVKSFLIISLVLLCIPVALFFLVLLGNVWARRLSTLYAVLMIINGIWHNTILIVTGKYFQGYAIGSNTGIGLIIMGLLLVYYLRQSAPQAPQTPP